MVGMEMRCGIRVEIFDYKGSLCNMKFQLYRYHVLRFVNVILVVA
jgi:hypothetical protein